MNIGDTMVVLTDREQEGGVLSNPPTNTVRHEQRINGA